MKISLHQKLNEHIRAKGQVSYNEIKQLVESGYFKRYFKMSTAERALRKSLSPDIESIENHGAIVGYKYVGNRPIVWREAKVLNSDGSVYKIIKIPINN